MNANDVPLLSAAAAAFSTLLGSIFAAADTALTALSSARLGALIEQADSATARAYERIRTEDAKLRSRYLLGRLLCTAIAAVLFVDVFRPLTPGFAIVVALLVTVGLSGFLFEISTTLGRKHADRAALLAVRWLRPLELAMLPLAAPLGWIGARLGNKDREEPLDPKVVEAEVEMMVDEVEKSGLFGRGPAEMIRNVLEFADRTARDVMIPRSKVEAIEVATPVEQIVSRVTESGHSRYPVFKDQLDNVVGLLYAKDLFRAIEEKGPKQLALRTIIRKANFVAESQSLSSLLREMRSLRQHLAVVVDELGAVSGVVTLEDVLEEIVGDIRDEHDETEEAPIQELGDGRLVADATVSMDALCTYLGTEMPPDGRNDSLGRMLTRHLGKVPEVGTAVSKFGLRFIVRDSNDKQVAKVEIVRPESASA